MNKARWIIRYVFLGLLFAASGVWCIFSLISLNAIKKTVNSLANLAILESSLTNERRVSSKSQLWQVKQHHSYSGKYLRKNLLARESDSRQASISIDSPCGI